MATHLAVNGKELLPANHALPYPVKVIIRKLLSHRRLKVLAGAWALVLATLPAPAIVDAELQMQLGNPSGATNDPSNHYHYLIKRSVQAIDYSDYYGQANWVSWDLTSSDVGSVDRTDAWAVDTNLPSSFYPVPTSTFGTYNGASYDRGHMCPSADRTDTVPHNELVFIMSNIIPQASDQNQKVWATFEGYCRSLLSTQELLITCGPSSFGPRVFASNHVALASNTWKIVVGVPLGSTNNALDRITNADPKNIRVIALLIPNTDAAGTNAWSTFVTSARQVEIETGFTFFNALPNNLAWILRSKVDGQAAPAPTLAGFSPASGDTGTTVTLAGTNLGFITNVTFNGTSATFTINSFTNITATVPAGATSGPLTVAGLGGNATSAASYSVGTSAAPDLAVTLTHTGNFTQGDTGDICTILVTNVGTAVVSGVVNLTNTLPAGLTATAISGTGWAVDLGTISCTRSDSLAAGLAYPAITVTLAVAANAAASVTNLAVVSGGGETNTANNTASDLITINAAAAPIVSTGTASGVGATVVTLNGTINPNGQPAAAYFNYGLDTNYGSTASIAGNFTGTTSQAVTATVTGLVAATTYHFRVGASNVLGSATGLDQTFTTAPAGVPDLAISVTHSGNFTQGDSGDTYTIIVTNAGAVASSGLVTVTNLLPAGLTATDISGSGWVTNLAALTCTRSDSLTAGSAYPAITVTVTVATNAPASVTNIAIVSGGGETNFANNIAYDPTTINLLSNGSLVNLAEWDMSTLTSSGNGFGPSPFAPTTHATNLTLVGLTRGSGVGTNGTAANRAWGGNTWTDTTYQAAITNNRFATFGIAANSGYRVSFTSISKFDYRHSPTGATNGLLQCQIGSGEFTNVATFLYPSNSNTGGSLNPIDLSVVPLLQNVGAGTNVTFRLVNWGGTSSLGTWYIFDVENSTNADFVVQGIVSQVVAPTADLAISLAHTGDFTQGDTGRTYTITVTNSGTAATTGIVSVTNTLPPGLVAADLSGTGWTADLGNLTCTRSDTLAAGDSYPPITLTVKVQTNAPTSVTNLAVVSGGGESITSNNTASDPTTILPATAPTVTTELATGISTTTATLNGMLNPNSQPTTAQFEYGLTSSYGSIAPLGGTFSGAVTQAVNAGISDLLPGTTYHFRLTATNVIGEATGQDQVFTTLMPIEAWRLHYFGTTANEGPAADTAIATSDGMPNLLKYALGLDPLVATNDPVAGDVLTGYLRLTAPKNPDATDVSFYVEVTDNLTIPAWTTNGTTVDVNTAILLQVHDNTPVAGSDAGYIRLRISRP